MLIFVFVILNKKKRKEINYNFPYCLWDHLNCVSVYLFGFNLFSSDVSVGGGGGGDKEMDFIHASVRPKNCIHNFS